MIMKQNKKSHREMRKFSIELEKKIKSNTYSLSGLFYPFQEKIIIKIEQKGENEFLSFYEQNKIKFEHFFAILFIL
jgi:hypothetical protein